MKKIILITSSIFFTAINCMNNKHNKQMKEDYRQMLYLRHKNIRLNLIALSNKQRNPSQEFMAINGLLFLPENVKKSQQKQLEELHRDVMAVSGEKEFHNQSLAFLRGLPKL